MEEIDVDLWWDVIQDIIQKDIRKVYKRMGGMKGCTNTKFLKWKEFMPSFEYEPLVISLDFR
jgi:hypothetical protein